jgi:uncharacterized membrane-anchored protein YjiN (DUF445 family)
LALALPLPDTERKRRNLLRIKLIATGLLPVMAALFLVSARYKGQLPALAWLEAFAEAALVGGLADWFAVVALFRHPGGLPLPHTAIIPRNKERIGRQLGEFVEQNFLTPENILAKLRVVDLAGLVVAWFSDAAHARRLVAALRAELPRFVDAVDEPEMERAIGRVVSSEIERLNLARISAALLTMLTRAGRHQRFLDEMLPILTAWLSKNREEMKRRFRRQSFLKVPWVDSYVVERLIDGVIDLLDEIGRTPGHEMRVAFDAYVWHLVALLKNDPETARKLDDIRALILRSRAVGTLVAAIWRAIKARLATAAAATDCASDAVIARLLTRLANEVLADRSLLDRLNANVLGVIETTLKRSKNQFAGLIEDIVRKWDTHLVTEKVELELGPDLQFIRLNGTFIGGLAGVALHAGLVLAAVNC